ncbi:lantibiotic dehydratase C-terminal domain-containing protein [Kitasatospora sp. NBC_01266]|uniref:lantibiotic dehydratase C-terminal domain-containing protein n=1 Tax=Kitasatospora sp. NBC_01266 TaxID=2903572 RepID=UPI002E31F3BA|nr:lantibiotic dehydratase C-terminal domain-containing protein [Kitasatospora sp. NBC_01266]
MTATLEQHPTALAQPPTDPEQHAAPAGEWQSFHIFYSASPRPLLLQCVEPLVESLGRDGLLAGHFFINYWLQGPHVRLRLRPVSAAAAAEVRERAEAAITDFLRRRPALYEIPPGYLDAHFEKAFALEYSPDQRAALTGPDGLMRLRPNNSFTREAYEPEYGKYGGPAGVALAEWHFQHSSELVIDVSRTLNLHLRTVALGLSAQLMMVMSACLLPREQELEEFFSDYHGFWRDASTSLPGADLDGFGRAYQASGESLGPRFERIIAAIAADDLDGLPGTLRRWADHCRELRRRVVELTTSGRLVLDDGAAPGEPAAGAALTDPQQTLPRLLVPYLHMTNNRLSMGLQDEAYLAYGLARGLRESRELREAGA